MKGYLPNVVNLYLLAKNVSREEIGLMPMINWTWMLNSKGVAQRAAKHLGWQPKGAPLKDTIAELVIREAKNAGLTPKLD